MIFFQERRRNEPVDLERVQQQMMYKDERIVELNSVILDKERQILDLQVRFALLWGRHFRVTSILVVSNRRVPLMNSNRRFQL